MNRVRKNDDKGKSAGEEPAPPHPDLTEVRRAAVLVAAITHELEFLEKVPTKEELIVVPELGKTIPRARRYQFNRGTSARLKLLQQTMVFLAAEVRGLEDLYASPERSAAIAYNQQIPTATLKLFTRFLEQMRDVLIGMSDTIAVRELGVGVDLADMALWRYGYAFRERVAHAATGANPIVHNEAREWWAAEFGADVYTVEYPTFYRRFLLKLGLTNTATNAASRTELQHFLNLFLNFPNDGIMTAYKFNLLDKTLGPLSYMADNFRNIVTARGFAGFINREQARVVLGEYFNSANGRNVTHPMFVLRFSRSRPEQLAATVGVNLPDTIEVTDRLIDRSNLGNRLDIQAVLKSLDEAGVKDAAPVPLHIDNQAASIVAFNIVENAYADTYSHTYHEDSDEE